VTDAVGFGDNSVQIEPRRRFNVVTARHVCSVDQGLGRDAVSRVK
jgi:hypothetical protein